LFGLDKSRQMAADCVQRALDALRSAHLEGQLPAIAHWVTARSH
jgi:hypothetical protein